MTREDIEEMSDFIIDLVDAGVKTADLHKTVQQKSGQRLGVEGKPVVRSVVDRHQEASREAFNDAQEFLRHLQHSKAHKWFRADEQARITSIAWASGVQKANAVRFHSVIITDTTFNTNRYKFSLALVVVVDNKNHSQIAMQALLSNERTESFQFVYESFKELCEGGSPKVCFSDNDKAETNAI